MILAGCGGASQSTPSATDTATPSPTATATATPSPTPSATPTPTPTRTPTPEPPDTPLGDTPLLVYTNTDEPEFYKPLVEDSLDYWESRADGLPYRPKYELTLAQNRADIVIQPVDEIEYCTSFNETTVGCAPLVESNDRVNTPVTVEVERQLDAESARDTITHELGHTLGLDHGSAETYPVMRAVSDVSHRYLPEFDQPNATHRDFTFQNRTLPVYVDTTNTVSSAEQGQYMEQITHALTYLESGADGHMKQDVSLPVVDNRSNATIILKFRDHEPTRLGAEWKWEGEDPDHDGAFEYYTKGVITIRQSETWTIDLHLGYALMSIMGYEEADMPDVFTEDTIEDEEWLD